MIDILAAVKRQQRTYRANLRIMAAAVGQSPDSLRGFNGRASRLASIKVKHPSPGPLRLKWTGEGRCYCEGTVSHQCVKMGSAGVRSELM